MADMYARSGKRRVTGVQAGRLLCVSETILLQGSLHSIDMLYGRGEGRRLPPASQQRTAGGEFVDLRELRGTASGRKGSA